MDDGINGVEEFKTLLDTKGLGNKAMLWVALFCDYDSLYRHFTESERARMISSSIFNDYDWKGLKNKKIALAIDKYKALQFDPLDAQLNVFNEKINQYTEFLKTVNISEDNAADMQKVMIGIDKMLSTRQKLLDAIERRGDRTKISGDAELSYLEKIQSITTK